VFRAEQKRVLQEKKAQGHHLIRLKKTKKSSY